MVLRHSLCWAAWAACAVVGCLALVSAEAAEPLPSQAFQITTRKAEDRVEIAEKKETTVFTITSPSGIGSATIAPRDGKWPATVIVQLRLRGLESLRISDGQLTLGASVGSTDDSQRRVYRIDKEPRQETPLAQDSPFWLPIQVGTNGDQKVFEVALPAKWIAKHPKSLTLEWIDFFRG